MIIEFNLKSKAFKMSSTRSQKSKNVQQESSNNVSESLISPVLSENDTCVVQDVQVAGSSNQRSPRIQNSIIENLRISLKNEITSEIKNPELNLKTKC